MLLNLLIMQLDVDIGSSSVARGVVNLVVGYLSKLVIELAFLIQVHFHSTGILGMLFIWTTIMILSVCSQLLSYKANMYLYVREKNREGQKLIVGFGSTGKHRGGTTRISTGDLQACKS